MATFKVTGGGTGGVVSKLPANRDTAKTVDQLKKIAEAQGKRVDDVARENPVHDHEKEITWPEASAERLPYRGLK